ncbi:predicted protein [Uncinocarpus reesii 1704]|uniref:Uncharacterized protein n=1 Tax=Uncinocarpus reesii (strain UAMH 1704) TaxID=336963 RepID=C4JKM0_UNCRE|nr:uncharacterized protein UREG_00334 [Uncinocarpus reesii 1704]EEP75488.1 predicted protein [Uncinocarpus reesii 1704]
MARVREEKGALVTKHHGKGSLEHAAWPEHPEVLCLICGGKGAWSGQPIKALVSRGRVVASSAKNAVAYFIQTQKGSNVKVFATETQTVEAWLCLRIKHNQHRPSLRTVLDQSPFRLYLDEGMIIVFSSRTPVMETKDMVTSGVLFLASRAVIEVNTLDENDLLPIQPPGLWISDQMAKGPFRRT